MLIRYTCNTSLVFSFFYVILTYRIASKSIQPFVPRVLRFLTVSNKQHRISECGIAEDTAELSPGTGKLSMLIGGVAHIQLSFSIFLVGHSIIYLLI